MVIYCTQFIRKEARSMFRKNGGKQIMMCCRMLISRACSVATTFGLPAVRPERKQRG